MINLDTQSPRHSVSVAGIVIDDYGRALLIRRLDSRRWEPPGGVLELGEGIHDGLRRKVWEGTGLDVAPIALSGVYKSMPHAVIALVFRCKITGGALAFNGEVSDFRWVTESETPRLMTEAYAVRVLDALHNEGPAAVRRHDGVHLLLDGKRWTMKAHRPPNTTCTNGRSDTGTPVPADVPSRACPIDLGGPFRLGLRRG
jgi:8-oxo-dGTP diphosphatase